ncbi:hypothetical protein M3J09_003281 [Ascochyta lentis]
MHATKHIDFTTPSPDSTTIHRSNSEHERGSICVDLDGCNPSGKRRRLAW